MELEPPRWKGGPEICPAVNLPFFFTEDDFSAFAKKLAPESGLHGALVECSLCDFIKPPEMKNDDCGGYHFLTGEHERLYRQLKEQKNPAVWERGVRGGIIVRLPGHWMDWCVRDAKFRVEVSRRKGYVSQMHGKEGSDFVGSSMGNVGEAAFRLFKGLLYRDSTGTLKAGDIMEMPGIEIRTRNAEWQQMIVRDNDKDHLNCVHCVYPEIGNRVHIAGWMNAAEAKRRFPLSDPTGLGFPAHWVEQKWLYPIDSLPNEVSLIPPMTNRIFPTNPANP